MNTVYLDDQSIWLGKKFPVVDLVFVHKISFMLVVEFNYIPN